MAHYFPYDVKLGLLAHSRSFLANKKARNAIVGPENLLKGISWMAAILCDVVRRRRRRRRRWAHGPVIHAASHFYHEKRVAWVSISMHACDPVSIVMGLRLAALRAAGAPL